MKPVLIVSLLLFCSCSLLSGNDDSPDIPGKLVFSAKDSSGTSQIFTMKANGTDLKQLTHFDASEGAYQPSWSPDGQQIVFSSFKEGTSIGPALWTMNADGKNQQLLYDTEPNNPDAPPLAGNHARWSPDGTKVAFDLCLNCQIRTNNDIYLFDVQTKEVIQLTEDTASDTYPIWSPDGSRIAFVSDRDYVDADTLRFRKDLYLVNIDDGTEQRVTETGFAREPKWGPQNNVIVFRSTSSSAGLYKVDVSTKAISMIKKDSGEHIHLHPQAWSSDGSQLLIIARNLNNKEPDSLLIINMKTDSIEKIYTTSGMNDADWYIPTKN